MIMTKVVNAYEGTRDVCSRMACKIKNALVDFFLNGDINVALGIIDTRTANNLDSLSIRMDDVAATGQIHTDDWEAVRLAVSLNNELSASKD